MTDFKATLKPDQPLAQPSGYEFDGPALANIDQQIRDLQSLAADALLNGTIATWVRLDAASAPVAVGQSVAVSPNGARTVTLATLAALNAAGSVYGIALRAGIPGSLMLVAIDGIVPVSITNLTPGYSAFLRCNTTTALPEMVVAYANGDFPIGFSNPSGGMSMRLALGIGIASMPPPPHGILLDVDFTALTVGDNDPTAFATTTGFSFAGGSARQVQISAATFAAGAASHPLVGADGTHKGIVIEGAWTEILLRNRTLTNAAWSAGTTGPTGGQSSADGGTAAFRETIASAGYAEYQSLGTRTLPFTATLWARHATATGTHQWGVGHGAGDSANDSYTASTTWQRRVVKNTPPGTGYYFEPADGGGFGLGIPNGAQDVVVDLPSFVESQFGRFGMLVTAGTTATNAPDVLSRPLNDVLDTGVLNVAITLQPYGASTEYGADMYVWARDANFNAYVDHVLGYFTVVHNGVTQVFGHVAWSELDTVSFFVSIGGTTNRAWYKVNNGGWTFLGSYANSVAVTAGGTFYALANSSGAGQFEGLARAITAYHVGSGPAGAVLPSNLSLAARRVMPLGDSITIGYLHAGYRRRFWSEARAAGVNVDMVGSRYLKSGSLQDGDVEGHASFSTARVNTNAPGWLAQSPPDDILLMIGTNTLASGAAQCQTDLTILLGTIKAATPSARVFVLSIPPNPGNAAARATYVAAMPGIVATALAGGQSCYYIDACAALTNADLADGVHPTDAGYEKMGAAIAAGYAAIVSGIAGGGGSTYVDGGGTVTGNSSDLTKLTGLAGLLAWWDARVADQTQIAPNLYNQILISAWVPRAGSQSGSASMAPFNNSPIYQPLGPNQKPVMDFQANGNLLVTGLSSASGDQVIIAAVAPAVFGEINMYLFDSQTGRLILFPCGTTTTAGEAGFYDGAGHDVAPGVRGMQILTWRFAGSVATLRRNGVVIGTTTYSAKAIGGTMSVGIAYSGASSDSNFYLGGLAFLNVNPSDGNLLLAEQELGKYYGP